MKVVGKAQSLLCSPFHRPSSSLLIFQPMDTPKKNVKKRNVGLKSSYYLKTSTSAGQKDGKMQALETLFTWASKSATS